MVWFFIIEIVSFLLPLLFFFIFKRKNKEKIVRVIFFYITYCFIQEFLVFFLSQNQEIVFYLFVTYTIFEFSLFCLFYFYLFPKGHIAQTIIKFVWPAFILFASIDCLIINEKRQFDSFVIAIESILLLLLCGYYLYYQITTTLTMFVYRTFNFWIIVTFLLYISATFFLYLMTDTMGNDPEFRKYYLIINFGANILKNALLCFAVSRKHVISPQPAEEQTRFSLDLGDSEIIFQKNI